MKRQIKKLLQPSLKCVDMVSTELGAVVQTCSEGVSSSMCLAPPLQNVHKIPPVNEKSVVRVNFALFNF